MADAQFDGCDPDLARRLEVEQLHRRLVEIAEEADRIGRRLDELARGAAPRVAVTVLHA